MTRGQDGGKHRPGRSPLAWTPLTRGGRERAARARADAETEVIPIVDVYPDSPAAGLAKFNLGSVPASVTPPRSWRAAAWFSVTASALVLVGLVYAAAALMTGPRKPEVVDALPGLPTAPALLSEDVEPTATQRSAPTTAAERTTARTTTATTTTTSVQEEEPPTPTAEAPFPSAPTPLSMPLPTPPPRVTVSTPVLLAPETDTEAMGDQTEAYYQQVVVDPAAAFAMTTGKLHQEGPGSIERRYAGLQRVEVESMTIDANRGTTRSRLRLVRENGTVVSVDRELTFTYGSNPMISADSAAG